MYSITLPHTGKKSEMIRKGHGSCNRDRAVTTSSGKAGCICMPSPIG